MKICLVFVSLVLASCLWSSEPSLPENVKPVKFNKAEIELAGKRLFVELAETPEQRARGLMYREKKLLPNEGMLFIFETARPLSFWMKNTYIPLSIGFFNDNRELINIEKMQPTTKDHAGAVGSYFSHSAARYALEVDQGWFERNNILPGQRFEFLLKDSPKE